MKKYLFMDIQYNLMWMRIVFFIGFLVVLFLAILHLGISIIQYTSLTPCLATVSIPLDNDPDFLDVKYSFKGTSYTGVVLNDNLISSNEVIDEKDIYGFVSSYFPQDFYVTESFNWIQNLFNFFMVAIMFFVYKILDILYMRKNKISNDW